MTFELGFPMYLIGHCRFTTGNAYQIRTQKLSPSLQGMIFSDTLPLNLFTSSALIPWAKIKEIKISDTVSSMEDHWQPPLSSRSNKDGQNAQYITLGIKDPRQVTIDCPWSDEFTDYVKKNKLIVL